MNEKMFKVKNSVGINIDPEKKVSLEQKIDNLVKLTEKLVVMVSFYQKIIGENYGQLEEKKE